MGWVLSFGWVGFGVVVGWCAIWVIRVFVLFGLVCFVVGVCVCFPLGGCGASARVGVDFRLRAGCVRAGGRLAPGAGRGAGPVAVGWPVSGARVAALRF